MLASIIMQKIKKIYSGFSAKMSKNLNVTFLFYGPPTSCKILQRSDNGKLQNFDGQTDGRTDGQTDRRGRLHRTRFQLSRSNKVYMFMAPRTGTPRGLFEFRIQNWRDYFQK